MHGERPLSLGPFRAGALGLASHYGILFVVAGIYLAASRRLAILHHQPIVFGTLFGIAVYLFMNFVVLPLSAFPWQLVHDTARFAEGFASHALFVGMPIALCVRRFGAGGGGGTQGSRGRPMRVIATDRLRLEPLVAAHAEEMFRVLSDPAIYEHENEPPASVEWLRERYRKLESRRSPDGREQWLNWVLACKASADIPRDLNPHGANRSGPPLPIKDPRRHRLEPRRSG